MALDDTPGKSRTVDGFDRTKGPTIDTIAGRKNEQTRSDLQYERFDGTTGRKKDFGGEI